jgi:hypothetical protein
MQALLVQWLEYLVANEVARVRFPDGAYFFFLLLATSRLYCQLQKHKQFYRNINSLVGAVGSA